MIFLLWAWRSTFLGSGDKWFTQNMDAGVYCKRLTFLGVSLHHRQIHKSFPSDAVATWITWFTCFGYACFVRLMYCEYFTCFCYHCHCDIRFSDLLENMIHVEQLEIRKWEAHDGIVAGFPLMNSTSTLRKTVKIATLTLLLSMSLTILTI